jgi:ABC-type glutathione transport system ATPase component
MQMIFQDPYASLDPRLKVAAIVGEPLEVHALGDRESRRARVQELLALVGLRPEHASRYPHQFSGGQRQRIGIARALYHDPDIIVLDEATSALDYVTERAVMAALHSLAHRKTILIVAHRLTTARACDRLFVFEAGRLKAHGTYDDLLKVDQEFRQIAV